MTGRSSQWSVCRSQIKVGGMVQAGSAIDPAHPAVSHPRIYNFMGRGPFHVGVPEIMKPKPSGKFLPRSL